MSRVCKFYVDKLLLLDVFTNLLFLMDIYKKKLPIKRLPIKIKYTEVFSQKKKNIMI